MTRSIYVIASQTGPIKVGIASHVRRRLSTLNTASSVPLSLAYSAETEADVAAIEQRAHEILEASRLNGEWFGVSAEEAVAAVLQAAEEMAAVLVVPSTSVGTKRERVITKRLGRPPVDSEQLNFRMQRDGINGLDAYRESEPDKPSRTEAIRRIITEWLRSNGFLK